MDGRGQPPPVPEADGGLAGPGRDQRLLAPGGREPIVPYVRAPEESRARQAAPFRHGGLARRVFATGVLVESHLGGRRRSRATRITRQPGCDRPLCPGGPARALRSRPLADRYERRPIRFLTVSCPVRGRDRAAAGNQGDGLRILTETVTSPTLARAAPPAYSTASRRASGTNTSRPDDDNAARGAQLAFGADAAAGLPLRQGHRHPGSTPTSWPATRHLALRARLPSQKRKVARRPGRD